MFALTKREYTPCEVSFDKVPFVSVKCHGDSMTVSKAKVNLVALSFGLLSDLNSCVCLTLIFCYIHNDQHVFDLCLWLLLTLTLTSACGYC